MSYAVEEGDQNSLEKLAGNRLARWLVVLLVVELAITVFLISWRMTRPEPPSPSLEGVDPLAVEKIRKLEKDVWKDSAESWRQLGEVYASFGFFPEAELCCRRAAQKSPESYQMHFWWGITLDRLGRPEEAVEQFREAAAWAKGESQSRCWYNAGRNLMRLRRSESAEKAFRQADNFLPARLELARLLLRRERAEEASEILDDLLADYPDVHRAYQLRARAAEALGHSEEAVQFRERAERSPENPNADEISRLLTERSQRYGIDRRMRECDELLRSEQLEAAAQGYQQILESAWGTDAAGALAMTKLRMRRPQEAVELLQDLIHRHGPEPETLVLLGDAYSNAGKGEKARESWEHSLQLRSTEEVHRRLNAYYRRRGETERARFHQGLAYAAAGRKAFEANNLQAAIRLLERSVGLVPDRGRSWYYLGESRLFLNQSEGAENAFRRCLELNPHNGRARRALARLREDS